MYHFKYKEVMNDKIKITIATLILMFNIQSCEEYLEILPVGQENSENYFNSPGDYDEALIGVYDLLSTTYLHNILGEIASDNSLCGGESPSDVLEWQQIDDMTHNPDNGALRSVFQFMYAGISRANYIVEFQDKQEFDGKAQILAENLFLRSYYYFELVKFFGDVPLYTDGRITVEGSQSIPRTPKSEVYAQLESDLTSAINNLPWVQSQNGRATKGAALALLGKIYLYQEKYTEAATTLDRVINSMQYQLVDDFGTVFLNGNENNSESVFEVQYYGGAEGAGFGCFQCVEGNIAPGFMGPRFNDGDYSPYKNGFSFNVPVQELYDAYEDGDTRRDHTIFDLNAFIAERPSVTFTEGSEHTGYFNFKYIPYDDSALPDANINRNNNYRAIRFSDVLLMAAEAHNLKSNSNDNLALQYLNRVRERAFGDTDHNLDVSGASLTQAIFTERRLELAGEGHRFFDQVRTGETSSIPGYDPNKHNLFPIPRIEIELAGNNWEQNPNY
jgi:tetratricopeptide (TPR) repeat protein